MKIEIRPRFLYNKYQYHTQKKRKRYLPSQIFLIQKERPLYQQISLKEKPRVKKLVLILPIFTLVTAVKKKITKNAENGENLRIIVEAGENNKNPRTNRAKVSYIRYFIAIRKNLYQCSLTQMLSLIPFIQSLLRN